MRAGIYLHVPENSPADEDEGIDSAPRNEHNPM